jgi:hypothetical protein
VFFVFFEAFAVQPETWNFNKQGLTGFDSKDSGTVSMPGIGDVAR